MAAAFVRTVTMQRHLPPPPPPTKQASVHRHGPCALPQSTDLAPALCSAFLCSATGTTIFNSTFGALVFQPQFLQICTLLPSTNLYGLGERAGPVRLSTDWERVVMFASSGVPHVSLAPARGAGDDPLSPNPI